MKRGPTAWNFAAAAAGAALLLITAGGCAQQQQGDRLAGGEGGVQLYDTRAEPGQSLADTAPLSEAEEAIMSSSAAAVLTAGQPGVAEARVLVWRREAYAAVKLRRGVPLEEETADRIREALLSADPRLRRAHVSAAPEFVSRVFAYADTAAGEGHLPGFSREFPLLIRETFGGDRKGHRGGPEDPPQRLE